MNPTERAIQSRIKEAFGLKISTGQWEQILSNLRKEEQKSCKSSEEPKYEFSISEVPDKVTQGLSIVIYPQGEEWTTIENQNMKEAPEWNIFIDFLQNYFIGNIEEF